MKNLKFTKNVTAQTICCYLRTAGWVIWSASHWTWWAGFDSRSGHTIKTLKTAHTASCLALMVGCDAGVHNLRLHGYMRPSTKMYAWINTLSIEQCFPIFFWLAPRFLTNKFLSPPYHA